MERALSTSLEASKSEIQSLTLIGSLNQMNDHHPRRVNKAPRILQANVDESETKTDRSRWRLLDERGRQRWIYLHTEQEAEDWPQADVDRYHLGLSVVSRVSLVR